MAQMPRWDNLLGSSAVDDMMTELSIAKVGEPVGEPGSQGEGVPNLQKALLQTRDDSQRREGPYRPLLEPQEIRVLELKPGSGEDEVRCSLHHCSLDVPIRTRTGGRWETDPEVLRRQRMVIRGEWEGPTDFMPSHFLTQEPRHALLLPDRLEPVAYTALSYTWGPNVFDALVELDGYKRPVTAALERALRRFRRPDASLVMWIDQLCINQADEGEKEKQIPLMGRVYAQSSNTLVWLGDAAPGSAKAIALLEQIAREMHMDMKPLELPADLARRYLPGPEDEAWKAVRDFFLRPWFTRVWINQEVWMPEIILAMCGNEAINWEMLLTAYNNLRISGLSTWMFETLPPPEDVADRGIDVIARAGRLWDISPQSKSYVRQTELIDKIRDRRCYDPRDKVYGLMGMLKTPKWKKVSYSQDYPTSMLYRDVAAYGLENIPHNLDHILASVDHEYTQTTAGLPSWVPDWDQARQTWPLCDNFSGVYGSGNKQRFPLPHDELETKTRIKGHEHEAKIMIEGVELHSRAVFADRVVQTSGRLTEPDISLVSPQTTNKDFLVACADLAAVAAPRSPYMGSSGAPSASGVPQEGKKAFEAFWRTLVADKDDTNMQRAPELYGEVVSFLLDQSTGRSPSFPGQTYSPRQRRPKGKGGLDLDMLSGKRTMGMAFRSLRDAAQRAAKNRRFVVTEKSMFGLVPHWAREGDDIAIIQGCNIPFVLRRADRAGGRGYHVIGECYVHGIMSGEVFASGDKKSADIVLV
ncbi:hypothetical protein GGTG_13222 [Gaeumannomyces tritici R3-111a-1]|uniref:Heterokaryon incompatibility domain-containing protein n=1 Tax=Gaeumannomyces tritici (strain R3-111a-1) TaxID=644352 RepID=J3PI94_GAET3|nr:hypothetical protein GGTG_13222 [Gaeumannomyces tritici R3-111a-1]EJT69606.1 hypothetical protein GGTG_13222 [Gaeumannomyces tritici R3-111a-1]